MNITQYDLQLAFKQNNNHYLKKVHGYLNNIYYRILFNKDAANNLEINDWSDFKNVENTWIQHETNECLNRYDCQKKITSPTDVELVLEDHPASNHELYQYLEQDATIDDLKDYILNESVLNLEFFDYLTLSVIGVSDTARAEIMSNLWDESGRGNIPGYHTNQFQDVMASLGLRYQRHQVIAKMSWEALAGINLFNYLSQYPGQKMKYFGLLAATEMLDPPHYARLLRGLDKYKHHKVDINYYLEHECIDVEHGKRWLTNVVLPELALNPLLTSDFWVGFYLRLDSVQRYYDNLLEKFIKKQAA